MIMIMILIFFLMILISTMVISTILALFLIKNATGITYNFFWISSIVVGALAYLCFSATIYAYVNTQTQNYIFQKTKLDGIHFKALYDFNSLFFLYITNTLSILISLGLLRPWSMIRTAKYKATHTLIYFSGDIDIFYQDIQSDIAAIGNELADAINLGLDIGL